MTTENQSGWNLENSYLSLPELFYDKVTSNPVPDPALVIYNEDLGKALGLTNSFLQSSEGIEILAGNKLPAATTPIAQSYAGHQFGHFTMLGDGRAMLIGEQITPKNDRFDIQLKGAGKTAYSRGGDGRAALGPMIWEYIISEAMHGLDIPTTRSLAVVSTKETIYRETELDAAILTRIAASHIRVGTFQFAAKFGEVEDLKALADYTMERHYPELKDAENPYLAFLQEVIQRQAALIAKWQLTGFIHGVMNTDNMTISGESIDYGPCAFMDRYDPETVFSSIDYNGRYAYQNQPGIAAWNLARFAETLLPFLGRNKEEAISTAQDAISEFGKHYQKNWFDGMCAKLGIFHGEKEDESLINQLLELMKHYHADYTNTFLTLTYRNENDFPMGTMEDYKQWKEKWLARLSRQSESEEEISDLMRNNNPALIPRNQWVEEAIDAAVQREDYTVMKQLLQVLHQPYDHRAEQLDYANKHFDTGSSYQTFCGT